MISDYECEIIYHASKKNVVVDALSRKSPEVCVKGRSMRIELLYTLLDQFIVD